MCSYGFYSSNTYVRSSFYVPPSFRCDLIVSKLPNLTIGKSGYSENRRFPIVG